MIGIFYGTQSLIPRRVVVPTGGEDPIVLFAQHKAHAHPLESFVLVPSIDAPGYAGIVAAMCKALGVDPTTVPSNAMAIVDPATALVVDFCSADPLIDTHPAGDVVALNGAAPDLNWKHVGGQFLARFITADASGKVTAESWALPNGAFIPHLPNGGRAALPPQVKLGADGSATVMDSHAQVGVVLKHMAQHTVQFTGAVKL